MNIPHFDISISDINGEIIHPETENEKDRYTIAEGTINVTLLKALNNDETIEWYINDILDDGEIVDNNSANRYIFKFKNYGIYNISGIIKNSDVVIGNISFDIYFDDTNINKSIFSYKLKNDDTYD